MNFKHIITSLSVGILLMIAPMQANASKIRHGEFSVTHDLRAKARFHQKKYKRLSLIKNKTEQNKHDMRYHLRQYNEAILQLNRIKQGKQGFNRNQVFNRNQRVKPNQELNRNHPIVNRR